MLLIYKKGRQDKLSAEQKSWLKAYVQREITSRT